MHDICHNIFRFSVAWNLLTELLYYTEKYVRTFFGILRQKEGNLIFTSDQIFSF